MADDDQRTPFFMQASRQGHEPLLQRRQSGGIEVGHGIDGIGAIEQPAVGSNIVSARRYKKRIIDLIFKRMNRSRKPTRSSNHLLRPSANVPSVPSARRKGGHGLGGPNSTTGFTIWPKTG